MNNHLVKHRLFPLLTSVATVLTVCISGGWSVCLSVSDSPSLARKQIFSALCYADNSQYFDNICHLHSAYHLKEETSQTNQINSGKAASQMLSKVPDSIYNHNQLNLRIFMNVESFNVFISLIVLSFVSIFCFLKRQNTPFYIRPFF